MIEHTPMPLSIQFEPHNGFGGNDPDGEPWPFGYISTAPLPLPIFELRPTFAFTTEEFRTYAGFIVNACNNHEALVKALEGALVVMESMPRPTAGLVSNQVQMAFDKRIEAVRSALANVSAGDQS